MINEIYLQRLIDKVNKMTTVYHDFLFDEVIDLQVHIYETDEHFTTPPKKVIYEKIEQFDTWGKNFKYAWFQIENPSVYMKKDQTYYLWDQNGAVENLVFFDDCTVGMFDNVIGQLAVGERLHKYLLLPTKNEIEHTQIFMEGYASHTFVGTQPYEKKQTFALSSYEEQRTFNGTYLISINKDVYTFIQYLEYLRDCYEVEVNESNRAKLKKVYIEVSEMIDFMPSEQLNMNNLKRVLKVLETHLFSNEVKSGSDIALIGHSHLDTAWLWTISETKRKLRRTMSHAIRMLKQYPTYKFSMSSLLYVEWIKELDPVMFEEIKQFVSKGRLEILGGAYVEFDCNLVSGESMVRQFLLGQNMMKENFNKMCDNFFLPDTFGYSASIPQILKQVNISYFLTTKLSWNDLNEFPYDKFLWKGIDKSEIHTIFSKIHVYPTPKTLKKVASEIKHKHINDSSLVCYGFGDGGGGPSFDMIENTLLLEKGNFVPNVSHQTVSEYVNRLKKEELPTYYGELYLELHRGTLTSISKIKRYNRKLEICIHDFEVLKSILCFDHELTIEKELKVLLLNQFHDILPGTSINEVNDQAIEAYSSALQSVNEKLAILLTPTYKEGCTFYNTTSFDFCGNLEVRDDQFPTFTNIYGEKIKIYEKINIDPFSSQYIKESIESKQSNFVFNEQMLRTPYYEIQFNENMEIVSMIDLEVNRQLCRSIFGQFKLYTDIPKMWDNWDLDYGYQKFEIKYAQLLSVEQIETVESEFRLRLKYRINLSTIWLDIIFNDYNKVVRYDVLLENNEKHKFLKVAFDTTIFSDVIKNEIQFGYVERKTYANNSFEIAQFENSQHKYSDLSERNYGITFLNDCKYGYSINEGNYELSLMKSGTHPDTRADQGFAKFSYAFLGHVDEFNCKNAVKSAYNFNYPPTAIKGCAPALNNDFTINQENIIVETIKTSENQTGVVLRLYEAEKSYTRCDVLVSTNKTYYLCNMLEEIIKELEVNEGKISLEFNPFEIKSILVIDGNI